MDNYYQNIEELQAYFNTSPNNAILVAYQNIANYAGMVMGVIIRIDSKNARYILDLEYISFGLDPYAENLMENYQYAFSTLNEMVDYLSKFQIKLTDIPKKYQIDSDKFPNAFKDKDLTPLFQTDWERFKKDFKAGKFLDPKLKLVRATNPDDWRS